MKPSAYSLIFFLIPLLSCKDSNEDYIPDKIDFNVPYTEINGDTSDFFVQRAFAWDAHLDGNFWFEENFFYNQNFEFELRNAFYQAKYEGEGIFNCRIFNKSMCTFSSCDTIRWLGSGVWNKIDEFHKINEVVFDYINVNRDQGYKIRLKEIPKKVEVLGNPKILSTNKENLVYFKKNSETDSIYFSLVIIPKENFKEKKTSTLLIQLNYPFIPEEDHFIVPGDQLLTWQNQVTESDSVFLNIVALKREFKIIGNRKVGVNYKVNNPIPIQILQE